MNISYSGLVCDTPSPPAIFILQITHWHTIIPWITSVDIMSVSVCVSSVSTSCSSRSISLRLCLWPGPSMRALLKLWSVGRMHVTTHVITHQAAASSSSLLTSVWSFDEGTWAICCGLCTTETERGKHNIPNKIWIHVIIFAFVVFICSTYFAIEHKRLFLINSRSTTFFFTVVIIKNSNTILHNNGKLSEGKPTSFQTQFRRK